jgi:hypothetical protein
MFNKPEDMVLHCPECNEKHIDEATPTICKSCGHHKSRHSALSVYEAFCDCCDKNRFTPWLNLPHISHRCTFCNHVWKPFEYPTNGVAEVKEEVAFTCVRCSAPRINNEEVYCKKCYKEKHEQKATEYGLKAPTKNNALNPDPTVLIKLGSLAVHVEEFLSDDAHYLDRVAIERLLLDPEVKAWLKEMDKMAFLPVKRKG